MIPELGNFALILALLLALIQGTLPIIGAARGIPSWMALARPVVQGQFVFVAIAFFCLAYSFVTSDFSVINVVQNSNSKLPLQYRFAATWGSHEGSLLLWTMMLATWSVAVSIFSRHLPNDMVARVLGVMGLVSVGFLLFMLFTSNPFERMLPGAMEGSDLNPLLQDPGMVSTHRCSIWVTWAFPSHSLLPFPRCSAGKWMPPGHAGHAHGQRLHGCFSQLESCWEAGGPITSSAGAAGGSGIRWRMHPSCHGWSEPRWFTRSPSPRNAAASRAGQCCWRSCAFSLSLLGTFLVRSGVLTSVHAFATDPKRGIFILTFLVVVVGGSLLLFAWRAPKIGLGGKFELVSRESMLLANNLLLMVAAGSVLLGTLYPLFMDALSLGKISVGPPYFEAVFVPLMTPAVFLMGLGPLARWKQASLPELAVRLRWAFAVSLITALLMPFVMGEWKPFVSFGLLLAFWVIASIIVSLIHRLHSSGQKGLFAKLAAQSRSYYGMHAAHLGIAVFIIGVTLVGGYETEKDVRMEIGDTVAIGGYTFRFNGATKAPGPNYMADIGNVDVLRNGEKVNVLEPEKRTYNASGMAMTEAAIDTGILRDLYVALGEPLENGAWIVRVYHKPFVDWIWFGCMLMAFGGFLAVTDRRYRLSSRKQREPEPVEDKKIAVKPGKVPAAPLIARSKKA